MDTLVAIPIFNEVMRRDRFLILIKFLHFADNRDHNTDDPGHDKLYSQRSDKYDQKMMY